MAAHNLLRLHGFTGHKDWLDKCACLLTAFSERMRRVPVALPEMVRALSAHQQGLKQVGWRGGGVTGWRGLSGNGVVGRAPGLSSLLFRCPGGGSVGGARLSTVPGLPQYGGRLKGLNMGPCSSMKLCVSA